LGCSLYDVTSTYLEGNGCELGKYGYNRDKKKGKTQIVFGLLCSAKGCPIAVEVFAGNTSDGATLSGQIEKVINGLGD
jgi:transposase